MRHISYKICRKCNKKYELHRSSWTTYENVDDIYKYDYIDMEEAGVTKLPNLLEWQEKEGRIVKEAKACSYKVNHKINQPDYCIVIYEVVGGAYIW